MRTLNSQSGFSLMEVLITMLVMAIGLLGLAGLQGTSLRNTESAYQRSQAAVLAYDILDRMRANMAGVESGSYDSITTIPNAQENDCSVNTCTSLEMAVFDDNEWHDQLSTLLPSGTGTVSGTGANSVFTITVMWDDTRSGATGTDCSGNNDVDLTCYTMSSRL